LILLAFFMPVVFAVFEEFGGNYGGIMAASGKKVVNGNSP